MAEATPIETPSKRAREEVEEESNGNGKKGKGEKGKGKGKPEIYNLVLDSVQHEYEETYSFKFTSADSKPIPYKAGQWGHLKAPGGEMGKGSVRHMSFASRSEDGHYLFTMDLSSKTPYKQCFAAAKPGDTTTVFKIKGEFVIDPAEQQDVVFVGGGIGITPMRTLIKDIVARELQVSCSLIHVAKSAHLYQAELEKHTNIPQFRTNHMGAADALASLVKQKPEAWYYLCGSQRFVDGMVESLQEMGISPEKIRTENFKAPTSAL